MVVEVVVVAPTPCPSVVDDAEGVGGAEDGGGIIPAADIPGLHEAGVAAVFGPGTTMQEVVDWVHVNIRRSGPLA